MRLFRAGRINGLDGITSLDLQQFGCGACTLDQGKGPVALLPAPSDTQASDPLELVHVDMWEPAKATSMGGKQESLTCYDNFLHDINSYFFAVGLTLLLPPEGLKNGIDSIVERATAILRRDAQAIVPR